ncbi:hypothetical protein Q8F55_001020 [Vanrija albida]|uniref:Uncharacterized protein n=1 Tax=Vanrija albida TaxID=181172 RepID=A0ABR3QEW9_9TREE
MTVPTAQEQHYYDQLFDIVDKDGSGILPGSEAFPFLTASGLPQQTLGEIWAIADPDNNGFLTKDGLYKVARLVGWMQSGKQTQVDPALISKPGPFPKFSGYPPPPVAPQLTGTSSTGSPAASHGLPPLTPSDRAQFTRIFAGCGPVNGLVAGDKARDVFLKSQLSYDKLGLIWNLADTQQRGALDLTDFVIGMWLIRSSMANSSTSTGTPAFVSAPTSSSASTLPWDVTAETKAASDRFFTQLDSQNRGVIEGDVAVPFMLQSQLDEGVLASIWDLSDIREEGKLDRDEFAVAMHLINSKLAGNELPTALPLSLVPPSLRASHGATATQPPPADNSNTKDLFDLFDDAPATADSPAPQPAFLPLPPSRRATQEPSRQTSRAAVSPSNLSARPAFALPQSQPGSDLLGDDGADTSAASALDKSAELGNKKNQLDNTARSVAALEKDHAELESQVSSSAQALEKLESDLTAARGKHEVETKAVSDLRIRVGEQAAKLKQLQGDVISAESDLTAMRLEKDELEQSLLRDKEEVRSLQKRMKEVEDEKSGLKLLLDKTKKDARQQKGMVTIAKKQLSTAEASRDSVQQDVRLAEQELEEATAAASAERVASPSSASNAAAVPLPHTPQTLSPEPTGVSQRSNNPFDRFSRSSLSRSAQSPEIGPSTTAAFVGVGAGIVGGTAIAAAALSGSTTSDGAPALDSAQAESSAPIDGPSEAEGSVDPFNAPSDPTGQSFEKHVAESDPFGAAPVTRSTSNEHEASQDATTHHGFADTFGAPVEQTIQEQPSAPDHQAAPTDFDSAFADFDTSADAAEGLSAEAPHTGSLGALDNTSPVDTHAETQRSAQTDTLPVSGISEDKAEVVPTHPPISSHAPAVNVLGAVSPTLPPQLSAEQKNVPTRDLDGGESSDEDEGPEDIDAPRRNYTSPPPGASSSTSPTSPKAEAEGHSEEVHAKTRRSAPPPPASRTSASGSHVPAGAAIFDPFGAPVDQSAAYQAPVTKSAQFDDEDDFDFTDLPPSHAEGQQGSAVSAFDDEFASFDDFTSAASQVNTGSDNSNSLLQTYEVVSPKAGQHDADGGLDEWGVSPSAASAAASAGGPPALSFDDAFGGDFSSSFNAPSEPPPPASAPVGSAPNLPKRPSLGTGVSDLPQSDDLEDVKRLCAMGFPRSLVVEALDANGYDFQKALNVLLVK